MSNKPSKGLLRYDVPILEGNVKHQNQRPKKSRKDQAADEQEEEKLTREVLDQMLPPRKFPQDGQNLIQFVSIAPATRSDVVKLQGQLDSLLQQRKARNTGICPIRSELYAQCFDEIIRQITIDCSARGKLLVRVRDELRMIISSYQQLYESAVAWGMRKVIRVQQKRDQIDEENKGLREEIRSFESRVTKLQAEIVNIERTSQIDRADTEKRFAEELASLKKQVDLKKDSIDQMLTAN